MALGCFHYWAFASTFEALEACHVPWEEIIILSDMIRHQREQDSKFIAEENMLWGSKGVQKHTLFTAKKASQSQDQMGSLTFEPEANDKWAEMIRWHCCLQHLSFDRLLLLAKLGEIPKYLLKVKPPTCAGCIFGAMTKKTMVGETIPKWRQT